MLNSNIIQGEKGKNLKLAPWSKFQKKIIYPKIFLIAQKMREEMHFEIYKSEPYLIPIWEKPLD